MKKTQIAYHVVTERPMEQGQILRFDGASETGVASRVRGKEAMVRQIYGEPEKFKADELEHHTRVALRELALERVRTEKYPQYPSRLNCLYASATLEEAEIWAASFVRLGRATYHIVKVALKGRIFEGDAHNCFDAELNEEKNLTMARRYWENEPNEKGVPLVREILADGEIEVLEIVREIRRNLLENQ